MTIPKRSNVKSVLNPANYSMHVEGIYIAKTPNRYYQYQAWSNGLLGVGDTVTQAKEDLAEAERFYASPDWENHFDR